MHNTAPTLSDVVPRSTPDASPAARLMHRVESAPVLDRIGSVLGAVSSPLGTEPLRSLLLGSGTGHALHPVLTDLPIGMWTSATVLDLCGGRAGRPAAQLLLGTGVLAAVPTALTGLAEWRETGQPESRVGSLHAALNVVALGLYAASFGLRRRGRHGRGVLAALAGMGTASVSGYLGGHLATARKVGTRDAAYEDDRVGPLLSRPGPG
ncbi:MAG TPA: DUF2231 domain-containing protein [Pedococcus sp.]|jgi:uncharacterized membrane protein